MATNNNNDDPKVTTAEAIPPRPPPPPHTESDPRVQQSAQAFEYFISVIFSISIFGASTFSVIAGQMADPADIWSPSPPPFTLPTVRKFLAAAWLCFVLAIAVAGYSSSVYHMSRHSAGYVFDKAWAEKWERVGKPSAAAMHFLVLFAFLFLALALVAYVGVLGWVAVGFASLAAVFVVGLMIRQFV